MGDFLSGLNKFNDIASGISQGLSTVVNTGGLFSTLGSLFGSKSSQRRAMRSQKELMNYSQNIQQEIMKYQSELSEDAWNKQNEYNSPLSQMQRYRDAGLNPNLIYGGSGSVSGNAESMPSSPSGASVNSNTDSKVMSGIAQRQLDLQYMKQMKEMSLLDSQIDLNESGAEKNRTEAGEIPANALSHRQLEDSIRKVYKQQVEQGEYYLEFLKKTDNYRVNDWYWKNVHDRQIFELNNVNQKAAETQIAATLQNMKKLGIEIETAQYTLETLMPKIFEKYVSEINLNNANARQAKANAYYATMNALYLSSLTTGKDQENKFWNAMYNNPHYRTGTAMIPYFEANAKAWSNRISEAQFPFIRHGAGLNTGGVMGTGLSLPFLSGSFSDGFSYVKGLVFD